ncbi:MAG: hypothetical protein J5986_12430, partial [Roseburia sp.]|nr:hypothetical protein [Roseburia sp.]
NIDTMLSIKISFQILFYTVFCNFATSIKGVPCEIQPGKFPPAYPGAVHHFCGIFPIHGAAHKKKRLY